MGKPLLTVSSYCSVVPQVAIIDEQGEELSEKFYKSGSTIELKCLVKDVPPEDALVRWVHEQRQLNYDTSRGGVRCVSHARAQFVFELSRTENFRRALFEC